MAGFKNDVVIAQDGMRIGDETISSSEQASVQFSESGSFVASLINNTSGTANSSAYQEIKIENTTAETVFTRTRVGNSDSWSAGTTGAFPEGFGWDYKADGAVSPVNSTHQPLRARIIAGDGSVVVRSALAVASEGERIGSAVTCNVQNVETTVGSNAEINVQVASPTGGFGTYAYLGLADGWSHGLDRNSSNEWILETSKTQPFPLGLKVMVATITGAVTFPNNPAFLAVLGTTDANATGDGTIFTLGSGNALTSIFDKHGDFNTNGTFTAPVTGIYRFSTQIRMGGIGNGHTEGIIRIVTTKGTYVLFHADPGNIEDPNNLLNMGGSILCDMDVSDTATVEIQLSNGLLVVDIDGVGRETNFCGELVG